MSRRFSLGWLALALALGGLVGWLAWRWIAPAQGSAKVDRESGSSEAGKAVARSTPTVGEQDAMSRDSAAAKALLAEAWAKLSTSNLPAEERADLLARLGQRLDALRAEDTVMAILVELASGRDADTGLPFVPGEEGLESATAWRVFLLDRLGRLDPRVAAEYARQNVFPSSRSAEEWAISLRNVWHSYPPRAVDQSRAEISALLGQMLMRPEWRTAQAQGLLEALDFVPHTADPTVHLEAVGAWIKESKNPATATAAQIALERTMGQHGDVIITALAASPDAQPLRAPAMARADLRRPAQAQAVADFLRRQAPESEEAVVFFNAFPLHRFSVAPGLAGIPRVPEAAEMKATDEAALGVITAWSADPSLAAHRENLAGLTEKLRELTGRK